MITTSEIRHPRFREVRDEYLKSQQEWLDVFKSATGSACPECWEDWLRDPFLDGTPIFSRINRGTKRGIVINQILPADDDLQFRAYTDTFASGSEDQVDHLVITSVLTNEAKEKARTLIETYVAPDLRPEDIERVCQTLGS